MTRRKSTATWPPVQYALPSLGALLAIEDPSPSRGSTSGRVAPNPEVPPAVLVFRQGELFNIAGGPGAESPLFPSVQYAPHLSPHTRSGGNGRETMAPEAAGKAGQLETEANCLHNLESATSTMCYPNHSGARGISPKAGQFDKRVASSEPPFSQPIAGVEVASARQRFA